MHNFIAFATLTNFGVGELLGPSLQKALGGFWDDARKGMCAQLVKSAPRLLNAGSVAGIVAKY